MIIDQLQAVSIKKWTLIDYRLYHLEVMIDWLQAVFH